MSSLSLPPPRSNAGPASLEQFGLTPPCSLRYRGLTVRLGVHTYLAFRALLARDGRVTHAQMVGAVYRGRPIIDSTLAQLAFRMNKVFERLEAPTRVSWSNGVLGLV